MSNWNNPNNPNNTQNGWKTPSRSSPQGGGTRACLCKDKNTYSRKYPLARGLFVYILKDPKNSMDPIAGEFIKYILSKDGQNFAKHAGYYPITNKIRDFELTRLGLMDITK